MTHPLDMLHRLATTIDDLNQMVTRLTDELDRNDITYDLQLQAEVVRLQASVRRLELGATIDNIERQLGHRPQPSQPR